MDSNQQASREKSMKNLVFMIVFGATVATAKPADLSLDPQEIGVKELELQINTGECADLSGRWEFVGCSKGRSKGWNLVINQEGCSKVTVQYENRGYWPYAPGKGHWSSSTTGKYSYVDKSMRATWLEGGKVLNYRKVTSLSPLESRDSGELKVFIMHHRLQLKEDGILNWKKRFVESTHGGDVSHKTRSKLAQCSYQKSN